MVKIIQRQFLFQQPELFSYRQRRDRSCFYKQQQGRQASILIVSLWALAVLSILSLALAHFIFQQIKFANFFIRSTVCLPLAEAAYQRFLLEQKDDSSADYYSYKKMTEQRQQDLCSNISYKYYYAQRQLVDKEEKFIDESALININLVTSSVLERLPGLDGGLADEIVQSSRRPFKRKEELLLIEGIDKEKFNKFKDLITVYGIGKININTVSGEVLSVLGLEDETIAKIMDYRQNYIGEDEEYGTDDDGAFTSASTIVSDLNNFTTLSAQEQLDLLGLMKFLDVKSEYIRLFVLPQIKGKDGIRYTIVIHLGTEKILSWQES